MDRGQVSTQFLIEEERLTVSARALLYIEREPYT
jgi:hypothetical protein